MRKRIWPSNASCRWTGSRDPSHIFGLASSLQGLGQEEEATALLASIAPLNAPGYAPAHLLLAQSMLGSPSSNRSLLRRPSRI